MSNRSDVPRQVGVIPYRRAPRGLEVLLVTSNTRKRWIIPKGNVEPHMDELESARLEAYEEAGVRGKIKRLAFGSYQHLASGGPSVVFVYLMEVENVLEKWPEFQSRERRWMSVREAYDHVLEPGLKNLLRELEELHG